MNKQQKILQGISVSPRVLLVLIIVVGGIWWYSREEVARAPRETPPRAQNAVLSLIQGSAQKEETSIPASVNDVIPAQGVLVPVDFGDLGPKLVEKGVIDKEKFLSIYAGNEAIRKEAEGLLAGTARGGVVITPLNAPVILNFLWAFGLGNKNRILEEGPMMDAKYGGAGNFASTGGWTLARGNAMEHYSKYALVELTSEQQSLVERVSKNVYRPCCGNSTYFPDCNHGMAMLGLLELLAAQGATEDEMYRVALSVNAYWFPDTYLTIAKYLASKGRVWAEADPKELLGAAYSSGSGYRNIASQVEGVKSGGGSCGVE